MDPDAQFMLIVILLLILLSAFFSSAETALTSVNRMRMRSLADDHVKRASLVLRLKDNQPKMLSTILIGNNVVNLTASALTSQFAAKVWGNAFISVATGVLTFVIIITGEILPKTIASIYAEQISMFYAPIIYVLMVVMTPVIWIVNKISNVLMLILHIDPNKKNAVITEDELLTVVDVSHEEGVIESEEREMIANVVDFGDSLAKDIMVPRIDVEFVDVEMSYEEVVRSFRENNFSRLPVYSETRDNVVGMLFLKDLFHYEGTEEAFSVASLMRKPYFTYEFKKTSALLEELRKESATIAVVLNEYGATAGILTLEDLLEEIVGEIRDEYDSDEQDSIQKISDTEYLASGSAKLDEINDVLGLSLESDDYDSIAGHIIHLMEHLPEEGEQITDGAVTYIVETVDKNRIDRVRILLSEEGRDDAEEA